MIDNTIMENLHNYLPKDLVNIVEEYSKDRTNYDKVLNQLELEILYCIRWHSDDVLYCAFDFCECSGAESFSQLKEFPLCQKSHMRILNDEINNADRSFWTGYGTLIHTQIKYVDLCKYCGEDLESNCCRDCYSHNCNQDCSCY